VSSGSAGYGLTLEAIHYPQIGGRSLWGGIRERKPIHRFVSIERWLEQDPLESGVEMQGAAPRSSFRLIFYNCSR